MAFPGVRDIRIAPAGRGRLRRRDHHGVRRSEAHRGQRARALLRHQHRSSSRQHRLRRRSTGSTPAPPPAPRWSTTWSRALGVPLTQGDRDPRLPGDPHRHRIVPLLRHLAADVRDLPRVPRGGRRSGAGRAQRLRQQQHGTAEAVRRGAGRDADRLDRPDRDRLRGSRDGARPPAAPTRIPRGWSTCR